MSGEVTGPVSLSHVPDSFRQRIPESLAVGDHPYQLDGRVDVSPAQLQAGGAALWDDPPLVEEVCEADGHAAADRVNPVGVAQVVGV